MTTVSLAQAIARLQSQLSLSNKDLAAALNVDVRTVQRWAAGTSFPQHVARKHLDTLLALQEHLLETFDTPEAARSWLHGESRYLGGLSPLDALRVQKFNRVEAALEALDSGAFV